MTQSSFHPQRRALAPLCALLAALLGPAQALAGVDLLALPALKSARADKSMLLNLAWAGQRLLAVGERGIVVYSDNGGKDWVQADVPASVTLTAVHFPSPLRGWAVGHDGIILTSGDGGKSWTRQFDGNQANALILEAAQQRLQRARTAAPDPAVIRRLEDGLEDAKAATQFGPSRPLFDVWFASEAVGYAVGSFGQAFRTGDGGRHWALAGVEAVNPDGLHINAVSGQAGGAVLLAAEAGQVFRLGAGADAWQRLDTGYAGQLFGVRAWRDKDGVAILLAYGFGGKVFRSSDEGRHWRAIPTPTQKSLTASVLLADGTLYLAAADGRLLKSGDGGLSFSAGPAAANSVSAMTWAAAGRTLILAGAGGAVRYPLPTAEKPSQP